MRPRALAAGLALLPPLIGLILLEPARVRDDAMAPTLEPGDLVLLWRFGRPPEAGDVVRLADPLDPGHTTFRRVLATGGSTVAFRGPIPIRDGRALRQVEMGRTPERLTLREDDRWLVALEPRPLASDGARVEVPEGSLFLAADHRDVGPDSRTWGPVPAASARGVAALRLGARDAWRGRAYRP